jgi:5-(aminomethyl)-3-furanmethanol phosphate kinase
MAEKQGNPSLTLPLVVKLGGSLYNRVPELVQVFFASGRLLLIVPGGGIFADTIRSLPVYDDSAHWMAIAAMDQYGWFIASQGMGISNCLQEPNQPFVFLPYCCMRQYDPLPHTWDITSDSIPAWVTGFLGLDLLLLKSVEGITQEGALLEQISAPVETDVVDPFFISFVLEKKITTTILNGSYPDRLEKFSREEAVRVTRIGATF